MRVSNNFGEKCVVWESNNFYFWIGVYSEKARNNVEFSAFEIESFGTKGLLHRIANFLKANHLTQIEIGEVLFYSQSSISNALNSPSPKKLYSLE